jgi:ribosome-binding factor A
MAHGKRSERIGDLLRDEISAILRLSMRDPRFELLGVTAVEVSRDLAHAKIFLSSARPDVEMESLLRVVNRARGAIRAELGRRRLDLRHLPELEFFPDRSIEYGSRIEQLLRQIQPPVPDQAPDGETKPREGETG